MWQKINWYNSVFLLGTLALTLTAVPVYLWQYGLSWFNAALFFIFFILTGLSITLGYHRLFSHHAFQASWPVRLGALIFGAVQLPKWFGARADNPKPPIQSPPLELTDRKSVV